MTTRAKYNLVLLTLYGAFWAWLAVSPVERDVWLLENMLVFASIPILIWGYWRMPLSRISYTLVFLFFCLHAIGAHFTYSLVPYDDVWLEVFNKSLNDMLGFERNHYDRFVHFCFGLLFAYPCREMFIRIAGVGGFWGYFLPLLLLMSLSMLYELIEWGAAVAFGGDLGVHYLGTQGDEWDGQRDMALATLGALTSMMIAMGINLSLQRDFAAEWQESLRVKDPRPLGEDKIARMLRDLETDETSD